MLMCFFQEFRRIRGNINSMKEHAELLSSVRDDISEYKVRKIEIEVITSNFYSAVFLELEIIIPTVMQASGSKSPRMHLLRERAAIHGSISHVRLHCY